MRRQSCPENVGYACRLDEEGLQFGKNGGIPVGLVVDLVALPRPNKQARFRQMGQFSLNSPLPQGDGPHDLTKIKRLPVMAIKETQHGLTGFSKQSGGDYEGW